VTAVRDTSRQRAPCTPRAPWKSTPERAVSVASPKCAAKGVSATGPANRPRDCAARRPLVRRSGGVLDRAGVARGLGLQQPRGGVLGNGRSRRLVTHKLG
jgi:hypothetical protein